MNRRVGRVTATTLMTGLPALALVAVVGLSGAGSSDEEVALPTVDGQPISTVVLDGNRMAYDEFLQYEAEISSRGEFLHTIVDAEAGTRGSVVSFSDEDEAATWAAAHGIIMPTADGEDTEPVSVERVTDLGQTSSLNGETIGLAACTSGGGTFVQMFDVGGCSGQMLSMVAPDQIPNMSTYGFNDEMSSANVGYCVSGLRVWINSSYTGSSFTYGGGQAHATPATGFNNNVTSAKTTRSAAC